MRFYDLCHGPQDADFSKRIISESGSQPQRGLTVENTVVTRWDASARNWLPVSLPSGAPLPK